MILGELIFGLTIVVLGGATVAGVWFGVKDLDQ